MLSKSIKSPPSSPAKPLSSPIHRPSLTNTTRVVTSPSQQSPSKHSPTRSSTNPSNKTPKTHRPTSQTDHISPTHIEVIERLRKLQKFSHVLPFGPEIPPAVMPYSKPSFSLVNRINKRRERVDFDMPEEENMEKLLKSIKETERIIRQEQGFVGKIRKFKPEIQLVKNVWKEEEVRVRKVRKGRNSTPGCVLRSGIEAKVCLGVNSNKL